MPTRLPKLPQLLDRKIYKTGQTRGADDDVIYQNRVGRNNTVLIPYESWTKSFKFPPGEKEFEKGFIVLISPNEYFSNKQIDSQLTESGLKIGINTLVFYYTRKEWNEYNPEDIGWQPAQSRISPLGGNYVARVPATTATDGGKKILRGFTTTLTKGAGIRVFEYANSKTIKQCRDQLEALFWLCSDSESVASKNGMTKDEVLIRKSAVLKKCSEQGLLDYEKLTHARVLNNKHMTICPLCLEGLSGIGLLSRMQQAEGREVSDLTVTKLNLFHIEELRVGTYNHRPYNIGWGHHHCNVVTRDSGIKDTLRWMSDVLRRNEESGYLKSENRFN